MSEKDPSIEIERALVAAEDALRHIGATKAFAVIFGLRAAVRRNGQGDPVALNELALAARKIASSPVVSVRRKTGERDDLEDLYEKCVVMAQDAMALGNSLEIAVSGILTLIRFSVVGLQAIPAPSDENTRLWSTALLRLLKSTGPKRAGDPRSLASACMSTMFPEHGQWGSRAKQVAYRQRKRK